MTSAQEFVEYAESVVARDKSAVSSVEIRSAVSRAYYGAYHACLQFEASLAIVGRESNRRGGIHEKLLQRLGNPDSSLSDAIKLISRKLSALLRQSREEREHADYHLDIEYSIEQAKVAVIEARKIVDLANIK